MASGKNLPATIPALATDQGLNRYLSEIRKFPILAPEEEYMLAKRFQEHADPEAAAKLGLEHIVITSVDRDDLKDGGAQHFVECIRAVREHSPATRIEILTPDFRGRADRALEILVGAPPDVMNHNLETVPRLYKEARPGSDYAYSLNLLNDFKARHPDVPTKSGLMLGLGETKEEVFQAMDDLVAHGLDVLTLGQYLQPTKMHHEVIEWIHPDTFAMYKEEGLKRGLAYVESGALVRSSYHAEKHI